MVTSVSRLRSCRGDLDVYTQAIDLAVSIRNITSEPVTIFAGTDRLSRITTAATQGDLQAGRFAADQPIHVLMDNNDLMIGQVAGDISPVVLRPGETVRRELGTALPVKFVRTAVLPGVLPAGQYVFRVQVVVKTARAGVNRWIELTSTSHPINLSPTPKLEDCR